MPLLYCIEFWAGLQVGSFISQKKTMPIQEKPQKIYQYYLKLPQNSMAILTYLC